jgi:hypothetical protein
MVQVETAWFKRRLSDCNPCSDSNLDFHFMGTRVQYSEFGSRDKLLFRWEFAVNFRKVAEM